MTVRMRHPDLDAEYDAQPGQVPHLRESGWQIVAGQAEQGETWPAEAQRFDGQEQVKIRHPETGGETVVARSAVPYHQERGWRVVEAEPAAEPEAASRPEPESPSESSTRRRRGAKQEERA